MFNIHRIRNIRSSLTTKVTHTLVLGSVIHWTFIQRRPLGHFSCVDFTSDILKYLNKSYFSLYTVSFVTKLFLWSRLSPFDSHNYCPSCREASCLSGKVPVSTCTVGKVSTATTVQNNRTLMIGRNTRAYLALIPRISKMNYFMLLVMTRFLMSLQTERLNC